MSAMDNLHDAIQNALRETLADTRHAQLILTGYVVTVTVHDGVGQKVMSITPNDQSPATDYGLFELGLRMHEERLNQSIMCMNDDEED